MAKGQPYSRTSPGPTFAVNDEVLALTVGATSSFTSNLITKATSALVQAQGGTVRLRFTGSTSVGGPAFLLTDGQSLLITSELSKVRASAVSGTPNLFCNYSKS